MALNSLALTRVHHMSKATDTLLTDQHMSVLEYAWRYYRNHSVGPLYQNIRRNTGITKAELSQIFPNGLNSVFSWIGIPIQSKDDGCKAMVALDVENPREVYFDHNATTPLRPEVKAAMIEFLNDPRSYGNASSAYDIGSIAFDAVDQARRRIAACLNVKSREIYFVGSGTEANNLAIKGIVDSHPKGSRHIVTSSVEHPSVLQASRNLETQGHEVTYLPVDSNGTLSPDDVLKSIRPDTIMVSVMAANNEIGTVYPLAEIGEVCRERNVPFVVDAIQGFGKIPLTPKDMGISILTMSGHKIGAPKGVGALFVDESISLAPQIHGGSQESGLRPGTENVLGIHAMGLAAQLTVGEMQLQTSHLLGLRAYFLEKLGQIVPDAVINGTMAHRLPNNLSIGFPGLDSGSVLLSLNQIGIFVSAGSACSAGNDKYSHVLEAIGVDVSKYGTVRFSFGMTTTLEDIDYFFKHLPAVLEGLRL
jgi:cysteine desulfurase